MGRALDLEGGTAFKAVLVRNRTGHFQHESWPQNFLGVKYPKTVIQKER